MDGARRTRKLSRLDAQKVLLAELLREYERRGLPIPPPDMGTAKAFRTRGAGAAGDKKRERRGNEAKFVAERVRQLQAGLGGPGVEDHQSHSDEQQDSTSESG